MVRKRTVGNAIRHEQNRRVRMYEEMMLYFRYRMCFIRNLFYENFIPEGIANIVLLYDGGGCEEYEGSFRRTIQ